MGQSKKLSTSQASHKPRRKLPLLVGNSDRLIKTVLTIAYSTNWV